MAQRRGTSHEVVKLVGVAYRRPQASLEYVSPLLTTVRSPAREPGVVAVQMLLETIQTGIRPDSRLLDPHLIIRESSGASLKSTWTTKLHCL